MEQSPPRKLSAPLLTRSDLDLAETRIKCQILEKQTQDEHARLQSVLADLKSVHDGNESARDAIREINAKIQQLELKAVTLKGAERMTDREQSEKRRAARAKRKEAELAAARTQLQSVLKDRAAMESRVASVKSSIAAGEQKIKDMESSIQQPVRIPSLKDHYVRGVVQQLRKYQTTEQMRAFAKWKTVAVCTPLAA